MPPKGLFITGTDTGIGKTVVTAILLSLYRSRAQDIGVMKPIETGVDPECHSAANSDTLFLMECGDIEDAPEEVCPMRFKTPAAPWQAARKENRTIDIATLLNAYQTLASRHEAMLVEGIGGALVPITENYRVVDLMRDLALPVIVVTGYRLGTLNHTMLTLESLQSNGLEVAGIIFNATHPEPLNPVEREQPALLAEWTGLPILGKLPYLENVSSQSLTEDSPFLWENHLNLPDLENP